MKSPCILFLALVLVLVSLPGMAADPTAGYLQELRADRFTRTDDGVITDHSTGLQWQAGPAQAMDWNQAQVWITALGAGWRTPTREELRKIYIPIAERNGTYPFGHVAVWAEARDSASAWGLFFTDGRDWWDARDSIMWYIRYVYAVRSR